MFWERQSRAERIEAMKEIQNRLRRHHRNQRGMKAHPNGSFLVPEWNGSDTGTGAAIPGHAPSWAL
jgi:phage terminase large subunit GpA-like protein